MQNEVQSYDQFLDRFLDQLPVHTFADLAIQPKTTALISVDMTNAFCRIGNLASGRVAALIPAIVDFFEQSRDYGVRDMVLLQDCHTSHAAEFGAFPDHAVCGSEEADAVDELKALPFYQELTLITKNSIHPAQGTVFDAWLADHSNLDTFIIVGDCTDLCVYQTVMHLRLAANAVDIKRRVIIPENCVNTYDLSIETALEIGGQPHPGDLLHKIFLHHMALNEIEVYKNISR